jgi:solute:Na+ symporter, SSS family
VFGLAAAKVVPGQTLGLIGVPLYIADVLPAPLAGVFFLGIWACALGWGGPCQFSGATSLGRDVGRALKPSATQEDLVRYTRWSLVLLTALMIVFGFLRTEESAWWNVLAWTLRNGATLAPVLGALFWPLATRRSVHAALVLGFGSGLVWYHLGGWKPTQFELGIHPVWVGMTVNVTVMLLVTLVGTAGQWSVGDVSAARRRGGALAAATSLAIALVTVLAWSWLHPRGLAGLTVFAAVIAFAASVFCLVERRPATVDDEVAGLAAVESVALT